jgi:hypothetical protein
MPQGPWTMKEVREAQGLHVTGRKSDGLAPGSRLSSPKSRLSSAKSRGSTPKKGEGKARKAKNIRFHPCSPGQVLQMCKLLGVDVSSNLPPYPKI